MTSNSCLINIPNMNCKGSQNGDPTNLSNIAVGPSPIDDSKHPPLLEYEDQPYTENRTNLTGVFGEECLAEATMEDKSLQASIK